MKNRWGFERTARCRCEFPAGTCANIECPHLLNSHDTSSLWVEGWALSKYSSSPYRKTQIGALIRKIKYNKSPKYSLENRISDAKKVSTQIISMIKWLYDSKNLPFDLCVCPPSHSIKPVDLPDYICRSISGGSIQYAEKAIKEIVPLSTIKVGPKEERKQKLLDNFVFDCPERFFPQKGILIIDDVFDTGSTVSGVSRAILAEFPSVPRFVITAAYIGHMGSISPV